MGSFYDVDFGASRMTVEELDDIARAGGVFGGIGYSFATRGSSPALPGGWSCTWTGTKGMGNHGRLVLVATDSRTRALLREGRIALAVEAGLTEDQARRWASARVQYKHELLPNLVAVLGADGDPWAVKKFNDYASSADWYDAGYTRDETTRGLSVPRLSALSELVRLVDR